MRPPERLACKSWRREEPPGSRAAAVEELAHRAIGLARTTAVAYAKEAIRSPRRRYDDRLPRQLDLLDYRRRVRDLYARMWHHCVHNEGTADRHT